MKLTFFQMIVMGVFAISAFIGLAVFATYKGGSSGTEEVGPVLIWGTLPKEGIDSTIGSLAQSNQDLKSVSYIEKDEDTIASELATAIATGAAPDLVLASQEVLVPLIKFISPISLSALPASTFVTTFIQEANILTTPSATGYYGVPFLVDPLVLFSNRTILSSSGIPQPPSTWEALLGLVPRVAVTTPSKQITRGLIALGTYDNVQNARAILSTLFLQTGVPVSSRGAYLGANLGSAQTGFGAPLGQAVLGFYTQFSDSSKVSYTWDASMRNSLQMFISGDLALYLGFASEAKFLRRANPNLNFIATTIPQPATASSKKVYGLLYSFMIPRSAKNPSGAYRVAALMTNGNEQLLASSNTGLAPATLGQLGAVPSDPVMGIAYQEALYADGWLSPAPSSVDAVFSSMIGNVISGRSTIPTALSTAEQALTALLQQ